MLFVTTCNIYKPKNSRVTNISPLSFTPEHKLVLHNAVVLQLIVTEVWALDCASLPATTRPSAVWMCATNCATVGRSQWSPCSPAFITHCDCMALISFFPSVLLSWLLAFFKTSCFMVAQVTVLQFLCLLFAAFSAYKHTNSRLLWTVTLLTYVLLLLLDKHVSTLLFASSSMRN